MSSARIKPCHLIWQKARRSMNDGDCVEVASADGRVFVRDSKKPGGPTLEYPANAWRIFLAGDRAITP
jgi:uncharacterized protein DUF397